jgi:hypothetical protein
MMARHLAEDEEIDLGPDEEDIVTDDHIHFYQSGKRVLTLSVTTTGVDRCSMWKALDDYMKQSNFYPNVWWISDHGNAHRMERPAVCARSRRRRRRR